MTALDGRVERSRDGGRSQLLLYAMFAVGVALIGWGYEINKYRAMPAKIALRPGQLAVPFQVDKRERYEIELELSRGKVAEETLLSASEARPGGAQFIDVRWQLLADGALLKGGSTHDDPVWYAGETVGRTLDSFDGTPKTRYLLQADIRSIPNDLVPARPALHVQVAPRQAMNRTAMSLMLIAMGVLLAIASLGVGARRYAVR